MVHLLKMIKRPQLFIHNVPVCILTGPIRVECEMASATGHVVTTIHHDGEERIYVSGYDNVGEYERYFQYYGVDKDSMEALKNNSLFCRQFMKVGQRVIEPQNLILCHRM